MSANRVVAERYDETIVRLALGIEPIDWGRGGRVASFVEVALERVPQPAWRWRPLPHGDVNSVLPSVQRHSSDRYAIVYDSRLITPIDLRIFDRRRLFVPRRFRIPVPTEARVATSPPVAISDRVRRPVLFPGAAYETGAAVTAIRGAVVRGGVAMRWSRVEARLPRGGELVGRAHGDDRGEFFLLISLARTHVGALDNPFTVRLHVFGPDIEPVPPPPALQRLDPFWDLPQERLSIPGTPDPTSEGLTLPQGYREAARTVDVAVPFGRQTSLVPTFEFT